jgi:hypothetical protein
MAGLLKYELIEFMNSGAIRVVCKYRAMSIATRHAVLRNKVLKEDRYAVRRIASNTIIRVGIIP